MHSDCRQYDYKQLTKAKPWFPLQGLVHEGLDAQLKHWVELGGSLTLALKKLSKTSFELNVLRQELHTETMLVREVELVVDGHAIVFAHSLVPLALGETLGELGDKPLGELLFQQGQENIAQREYAFFETHGMHSFARRTPYKYQGHTVYVSEYFLPPFFELIKNE